ncbi:MAG: hypothetical protein ROR55_16280 [Devosia sp.]
MHTLVIRAFAVAVPLAFLPAYGIGIESAWAQSPDQAATAIQRAASESGGAWRISSTAVEGDRVVLKDTRLSFTVPLSGGLAGYFISTTLGPQAAEAPPWTLTLSSPEVSVHVPEVGGEIVSAARLSIPSLTLSSKGGPGDVNGPETYTFTGLELHDVAFPAFAVAGEVDPAAAADWLSGVRVGRANVMADDTMVEVEGMAEGRITTFIGAGTQDDQRLMVTGTDVSALTRNLFADSDDGAPATLATAATFGPLTIPLPTGDALTVPFLEATNVTLAPVSALTPQETQGGVSAMDMAGIVLGLFSADNVVAQNVTHTSAGIDTKVERVTLSGLSPEGFRAFTLEGFSTTEVDNKASMASLSVNDVRWVESRFGVGPDIAELTAPTSSLPLAGYPKIGAFSVEALSIEGPTMDGGILIPAMSMEFADHIGPIPTKVTYDVQTVVQGVGESFPPDINSLLNAKGFETFNVRESGNLSYDRATEAVTLQTKSDYESLGVLDLHMVMSGIPVIAFEQPARAYEAIGTAAIADMTLRFDDQGAIDLLQAVFVQSTGATDEEVLPQWMGMVRGVMADFVPPERAEPMLAALQTFLADKGTLTLTAEPPAPVSFVQLATGVMTAPGQILNILNVTVTADP